MLRFFIYILVMSHFRKLHENIFLISINPLFLGIFLILPEVNLLLNNYLREKQKLVKFLHIVKN